MDHRSERHSSKTYALSFLPCSPNPLINPGTPLVQILNHIHTRAKPSLKPITHANARQTPTAEGKNLSTAPTLRDRTEHAVSLSFHPATRPKSSLAAIGVTLSSLIAAKLLVLYIVTFNLPIFFASTPISSLTTPLPPRDGCSLAFTPHKSRSIPSPLSSRGRPVS